MNIFLTHPQISVTSGVCCNKRTQNFLNMSRASARIIGGQSVLDAEERDSRRIAAMRVRNEQRRNRFLTAKVRLMGVDTQGIEQQKAEKAARRAAEKAADMAYSDEQRQIRDLVEANLAKEQRDEYDEKRRYAEQQLQAKDPSLRREYHLNDPRGLQKERKTTADALEAVGGAGRSSMLAFDGEDRNYGDRKKIQEAQMRDWTTQQVARKQQRAADEAEDKARHANNIRDIVNATGQIEAKEASEKYEEALYYAEANKQLALDSQHRRQRRAEEEASANRQHVSNMRDSAWLSENPSAGLRVGGVRRDQWKGMNVTQLQSHYDAQYDQMIEKQNRNQQRAAEDAEFKDRQDMIQDAMQHIVLKEQIEHQQMERDYRLAQAEQATRKIENKRNEITTNAVTDEYFNYFGSSHR